MFKNVASQKIAVFAYDSSTGAPKTGDAANITAYVSKDYGAVTVLGDTTATEMDATNAKGMYLFDLTQAETNADCLIFTGKSSTANIFISPQTIYTDPPNYTTMSIDGNGRLDIIKINGTSQTARDIGASVIVATNNDKTGYTLSAAGISGIWQDTTAGDFTVASSIGKSIMNGVALGTGLTINQLTTNNDKTGYALTSGERDSVADALLARNVAGGSSSGRLVKEAFYFLRNKFTTVGGTLTVYQTDDSTISWTATLTTDNTAQPIVTSDPA